MSNRSEVLVVAFWALALGFWASGAVAGVVAQDAWWTVYGAVNGCFMLLNAVLVCAVWRG